MSLLTYLAVFLLTVGPCVAQCTNGNLRLTDGSSGVLQICKNNEWRSVCSEDWGNLDTAVACRQYGYDGGYTQSTRSSSQGITVDPVEYHCNGRENNLQDCHKILASRSCSNSDVVTIACVYENSSDPCSFGDIRLWGGETEYEGNIEICTNHSVWSAVYDHSWGTAGAIVAYKQLNYTDLITLPYSGSAFGRRVQPAEYGGLICQGTELSLQQCAVSSSFVRTWSKLFFSNERDYAGVKCTPKEISNCTSGTVRLTNGYSENNGLAEICIDGAWIGVCRHSLRDSTETSLLICKQLGYAHSTTIDPDFFRSNGNESQAYVSLRCRSRSSVLLDCIRSYATYGILYVSSCTPHGVLCCPNDIASCGLTSPASTPPTAATTSTAATPPTTSTTAPPTTSTTSTPPPKATTAATSAKPPPTPPSCDDVAHFSLHFGAAATSLILSFSGDLRGLEEDIHSRVVSDISEGCDCPFDTSALKEGSFSVGEYVVYSAKVSAVGGHCATDLVALLKRSIDNNPLIQFHSANLYIHVKFVDINLTPG